ncbi:MAG: hypothetical protein ACON5A_00905 [Candidatus Comchoanobacterales bacterium]
MARQRLTILEDKCKVLKQKIEELENLDKAIGQLISAKKPVVLSNLREEPAVSFYVNQAKFSQFLQAATYFFIAFTTLYLIASTTMTSTLLSSAIIMQLLPIITASILGIFFMHKMAYLNSFDRWIKQDGYVNDTDVLKTEFDTIAKDINDIKTISAKMIQSIARRVIAQKNPILKLAKWSSSLPGTQNGVYTGGRYIKNNISAKLIQSLFRGYNSRKKFVKLKAAVVKIQSIARGFITRKNPILKLAKRYLSVYTGGRYIKNNISAKLIQSTFKAYKDRTKFVKLKAAVVKFQSIARGVITRKNPILKLAKWSSSLRGTQNGVNTGEQYKNNNAVESQLFAKQIGKNIEWMKSVERKNAPEKQTDPVSAISSTIIPNLKGKSVSSIARQLETTLLPIGSFMDPNNAKKARKLARKKADSAIKKLDKGGDKLDKDGYKISSLTPNSMSPIKTPIN